MVRSVIKNQDERSINSCFTSHTSKNNRNGRTTDHLDKKNEYLDNEKQIQKN